MTLSAHPKNAPTMRDGSAAKDRVRLWLRILKVHKTVEGELRERLRLTFDTTLPRFDVMAALARNEQGMKMSELSRMLMVSNGNVTGIVDRLTQDGLMLREAVPGDRRAARVRLTSKGAEEFAKQAEAHEQWVSELLGGIEGEDSQAVADLLLAALRPSDDTHNGVS
ncbi:MAG: MarR family winged helix-turn-helix transcriptional regulator [Pikeienuella sp.]